MELLAVILSILALVIVLPGFVLAYFVYTQLKVDLNHKLAEARPTIDEERLLALERKMTALQMTRVK